MIAAAVAVLLALASPPPGCSGPDISVTDMSYHVVKGNAKTQTPDRVLIAADIANVGTRPQQPNVKQHVELVRDGSVVQRQALPPLASGVTYPMQFRIFRDVTARRDPLEVLVRYVLDDPAKSPENNCASGNDALQKIF
jgi:hypothetical protein